MRKYKVIVIGGSLCGLFVANLLHDLLGWEVDVFEKAGDDLASRGAGIATHDEMFSVIRRLGLQLDESYGILVNRRRVIGKNGEVQNDLPNGRLMSSWSRLYKPLKDHFPQNHYHFGKNLRNIEFHDVFARAIFEDSTQVDADLILGCDGFRSKVRQLVFPQTALNYASYIAWRGLVEEAEMSIQLRENLIEHVYALPLGQFLAIYPVPGHNDDIRPGNRRCNLIWYHPTSLQDLEKMCIDVNGHYHGNSISPDLIRPDVITLMRNNAKKLFAPSIVQFIDLIKKPFFQPIFDLESHSVISHRVVLMGDAAFVARPHLGMGTTKAALDANWFVDSILNFPDDLSLAFTRYNKNVTLFGSRCVAYSRFLGAHLEAQITQLKHLQNGIGFQHLPLPQAFGPRLREIPELAELID